VVRGSFSIIYEGGPECVKQGIALLEEEVGGDGDKGEDEENTGLAFLVKLIDFAHTMMVSGEEPDKGRKIQMKGV